MSNVNSGFPWYILMIGLILIAFISYEFKKNRKTIKLLDQCTTVVNVLKIENVKIGYSIPKGWVLYKNNIYYTAPVSSVEKCAGCHSPDVKRSRSYSEVCPTWETRNVEIK